VDAPQVARPDCRFQTWNQPLNTTQLVSYFRKFTEDCGPIRLTDAGPIGVDCGRSTGSRTQPRREVRAMALRIVLFVAMSLRRGSRNPETGGPGQT